RSWGAARVSVGATPAQVVHEFLAVPGEAQVAVRPARRERPPPPPAPPGAPAGPQSRDAATAPGHGRCLPCGLAAPRSPPPLPGSSTISSQYFPRALTPSTSASNFTGLVMNEAALMS